MKTIENRMKSTKLSFGGTVWGVLILICTVFFFWFAASFFDVAYRFGMPEAWNFFRLITKI